MGLPNDLTHGLTFLAPVNPSNSIASNNAQVWGGEKFSLFVGGLPEGLEDGWLERILGVSSNMVEIMIGVQRLTLVQLSDCGSCTFTSKTVSTFCFRRI